MYLGIFLYYDSSSVIKISRFLPTYWYSITNNRIDKFHDGLSQYEGVLKGMGIQLIFALIFFGIGVYFSKKRAQATITV